MSACTTTNGPSAGHGVEGTARGPISFDDYVAQVLRDWDVPGMAVALVRDDRVVLAKGYGMLRLGEQRFVDADTIFQVGSLIKPFVAVASSLLATEGRWSLDDRVGSRIRTFRMVDPYATREFRVRDLLAHHSGFATFEGDFLWIHSDLNDAEILQRLAVLQPRFAFRARFGYSNLMFMTAARALESVLGMPWTEYLRTTFFEPLHMNRTVIGTGPLKRLSNVASPHSVVRGTLQPVDFFPVDNCAGAGGLATSVHDLSRWLLLMANQGRLDGRQILPEAALRETWTPQTPIPLQPLDTSDALAMLLHCANPSLSSAHYGLGWVLFQHRGYSIVMHGGALPGSTAALAFAPDRHVGVAAIANTEDPRAVHAILFRGLEELLGLDPADWNAEYVRQRAADPAPPAAGVARPQASASGREDLAGRYASPEYGGAEIRLEASALVLRLEHHPGVSCQLALQQQDRYGCTWSTPSLLGAEISFTRDRERVSGFDLIPDPFIDTHKYVFRRVE